MSIFRKFNRRLGSPIPLASEPVQSEPGVVLVVKTEAELGDETGDVAAETAVLAPIAPLDETRWQKTREHAAHVARLALGISNYDSVQRNQSLLIVRRFSLYSVAGGVIPVPGLDMAAMTAIQLRMLAKIAKIYDVPFTTHAGRVAIGALMLGVPQALSQGVAVGLVAASPMAKLVPGPGTIVGQVAMAGFGATVTYALGVVFIDHFESGGTVLDFDADAAKISFREELERAWAVLVRSGGRFTDMFRFLQSSKVREVPFEPQPMLVRRPRRKAAPLRRRLF